MKKKRERKRMGKREFIADACHWYKGQAKKGDGR